MRVDGVIERIEVIVVKDLGLGLLFILVWRIG